MPHSPASAPNQISAPSNLPEAPLSFNWAAISKSGKRKPENDDSVIICAAGAKGSNPLPNQGSLSLDDNDLVFAISDGMGGGKAGHIASAQLLKELTGKIPETIKLEAQGLYPDYVERLKQCLSYAHDSINRQAAGKPELEGMSATLTCAWFTPNNLYLGHAGDSRLYRLRAGQLEQLSHDHTFAWKMWQRGELSEYQYRQHPRRSALYEVIGGGHLQLNPHTAAFDYQRGDVFLLCSDGLIDGLWERHLHEAITNHAEPLNLCQNLIEKAYENAGEDDTSAICIKIF